MMMNLTADRLRSVLDYDPETGIFTWRDRPRSGFKYSAHRLAWLYVHGEWPSQHIDHINGDGCDNRIANLRDVSNTENHRNTKRHKTNRSGVTGVNLTPYGTWGASIWDKHKVIRLGSFQTQEEAVSARKQAEKQLGYHPNHGRAA